MLGLVDPRADQLRAGYAPVARAYADELGEELSHKPLDRGFLDAFAATVATVGAPILEVGCGPGQVAAYLHARGADVSGLDLSPEMIAAATADHPAIAFAVGDMCALPHGDASLGGVVAFYAVVHLPTEELLLPFREFRRVLAPGGHLALAFHAGNEAVHVDELFGCATSLNFFFHDPDAVVAALTLAGFTLEARLDRAPYRDVEHPTRRSYLLASVPASVESR
jgi:SAM-dependent methyltransferase